jgi:hypothetical protein
MKPLEHKQSATFLTNYVFLYSSVLVTKCLQWQKDFRERETIRLCLKHFREQNYLEVSTRQLMFFYSAYLVSFLLFRL